MLKHQSPYTMLISNNDSGTISWRLAGPYIGIHLACFTVAIVGFSWTACSVAFILYWIRMFCITGFYHRYFSHRTFKTSRVAQCIFAILACTAAQRGPLWWLSQHRHHHISTDTLDDPHSPQFGGFFKSHVGWFLLKENVPVRSKYIKDFESFPEIKWLEDNELLPVVVLGFILFISGEICRVFSSSLHTNGPQLLVWGLCISTVVLYHATYTINSLAHCWGSRTFSTNDNSRNNLLLALITLGEGWHNNHHRYPLSTRQGFKWWQIDLTYYGLKVLAWLNIIWDLKPVPQHLICSDSHKTQFS